MTYKLLSTTAKLDKSLGKSKYIIRGLSLAPAKTSGRNVCQYHTITCAPPTCVAESGKYGKIPSVLNARIRKTNLLFDDPTEFARLIAKDIEKHIADAKDKDLIPCLRMNVFSDIPWERKPLVINGKKTTIVEEYGDRVILYDYTKYPYVKRESSDEYHLTYSVSGEKDNVAMCRNALYDGHTAAVVFDTKPSGDLPKTWYGHPVIDGDKDDLRFLDPAGTVVGLRAKGGARGKQSSFVYPGVDT